MADPRTDLYGQNVAGDYFRQLNNLNQVQDVLNVLVPVQDQKQFQRRIRTRQITSNLTVGQKVSFFAIVPVDPKEAWKIHYIGIGHDDGGNLNVVAHFRDQKPASNFQTISRRAAPPNVDVPLYPAKAINAGTSVFFDTVTGPPYEMFPGDLVEVITETPTANANVKVTFIIRYELIPPPVRLDDDEVFADLIF